MSPPCQESQGCCFIPLYYLLFFCLLPLLFLTCHFSACWPILLTFLPENSFIFFFVNFSLMHHTLWDDRKFFLPATSATDGRQALRHSWRRCTLVCDTNVKNSAAGLLIVKWIQLLLVFSLGYQPPQRVINLDPAF